MKMYTQFIKESNNNLDFTYVTAHDIKNGLNEKISDIITKFINDKMILFHDRDGDDVMKIGQYIYEKLNDIHPSKIATVKDKDNIFHLLFFDNIYTGISKIVKVERVDKWNHVIQDCFLVVSASDFIDSYRGTITATKYGI